MLSINLWAMGLGLRTGEMSTTIYDISSLSLLGSHIIWRARVLAASFHDEIPISLPLIIS